MFDCSRLATGLDVAKAASGAGAVVVAVLGLKTWRRQLHGTTEFDMARRLMRAVYAVRDRIAEVRNPFISGGEFAQAFREAGIEPDSSGLGLDKRSDELVYDRRWRGVAKGMSDLDIELLEAEVLWGESVRAAERDLRFAVAQLQVTIVGFLEERRRPLPGGRRALPDQQRQREILYDQSTPAEPDGYQSRIIRVVKEFEAIAIPHLTRARSRTLRGHWGHLMQKVSGLHKAKIGALWKAKPRN